MNSEQHRYSPRDVKFRPAVIADGSYLLDLEERCMREHAEALWGRWRPSASLRDLDVTGHEIVEVGGRRAGCAATTWLPAQLTLNKLYIAPGFQNGGLGAIVLRRVVRLAERRGVPVRLSVLASNRAIRFYLREGFAVETETAERRRLVRMPKVD